MSDIDAYAPKEIAERVRSAGLAKAELDASSLLVLAVLAGAFIGLGAAFSTVASTGFDGIGFGAVRLLAGIAFSLGLVLVVLAGAELFTGNNLIVMGWASGSVTGRQLLRNWFGCYIGNGLGALATAALVCVSGAWRSADYGVGATAVKIAAAKANLEVIPAFFLGILCNALVCLAVWLCFGARGTTDKVWAILFPITAFVALGFEHSVANMYFFGIAFLLQGDPGIVAASGVSSIATSGAIRNLLAVTLGNVVGGGGLVALVYWFVYLRPRTGSVDT